MSDHSEENESMEPSLADQERAERYASLEAEAPTISAADYRTRSRRSLLTGAAAAAVGFAGFRWIQGRPDDNRIPDVLRQGHEANEALWRGLSRESAMAPTFDRSKSSMPRVNGRHGIREEIDLDTWELRIEGPDGKLLGTHTMDDIRALPFHEMTIEHKCVEGWSHIVTWGGARFSDFAALYADALGSLPDFVSLVTPDEDYYVGMDRASMMHPQTFLAYELQGEDLDQDHGAPLRLASPNKYGIKLIKRIGTIRFTDEQPTDYWYERGYDWYAQL